MDEAKSAPDHITTTPPLLFLYGAKDQIIPVKPTEAVIAALQAKPGIAMTVRHYEHGYHMLLRDLDGATVDQGVVDWVFAHAKAGQQKAF
jgi:alpha-beta hydrolase superfamily lysophospholipase